MPPTHPLVAGSILRSKTATGNPFRKTTASGLRSRLPLRVVPVTVNWFTTGHRSVRGRQSPPDGLLAAVSPSCCQKLVRRALNAAEIPGCPPSARACLHLSTWRRHQRWRQQETQDSAGAAHSEAAPPAARVCSSSAPAATIWRKLRPRDDLIAKVFKPDQHLLFHIALVDAQSTASTIFSASGTRSLPEIRRGRSVSRTSASVLPCCCAASIF